MGFIVCVWGSAVPSGGRVVSYLAFQLDLVVVTVWNVPLRKTGLAPVRAGQLVAKLKIRRRKENPYCRFCIRMNESIAALAGRVSWQRIAK